MINKVRGACSALISLQNSWLVHLWAFQLCKAMPSPAELYLRKINTFGRPCLHSLLQDLKAERWRGSVFSVCVQLGTQAAGAKVRNMPTVRLSGGSASAREKGIISFPLGARRLTSKPGQRTRRLPWGPKPSRPRGPRPSSSGGLSLSAPLTILLPQK